MEELKDYPLSSSNYFNTQPLSKKISPSLLEKESKKSSLSPFKFYEDIMEETRNLPLSKSPSSPSKLLSDYFLYEGCNNIYKHLSEIELLSTSGVSDSIIISAILNYEPADKKEEQIVNQNVILKISYIPKSNVLNNKLAVEEEIYRNVISNLINNNHTPHLIKYITSILHCNLDFKKFPEKSFKNDITLYQITKRLLLLSDYNINDATITILTKSNGKTLHETFPLLNNEQQLIVMFQLLYTILCFNNITLRHNDLHFRNIFVEQTEWKHITYKIFGEIITIYTNLDCKIYDFDRAAIYHPSVDRNYALDIEYCTDFNQCSGIDTTIDLQAIIGSLLMFFIIKDDLKTWINQITSEKFRTQVKSREYGHILPKGKSIKSKHLLPIKTCIKSLLHFMKKNNIIEEKEKNPIIQVVYEPPLEYKIKEWFPISSHTYVCTKIEDKNNDFDEKEIDKIPLDLTILFSIYNNEFSILKYNILKTTKELFLKFNKLKNIKDKDNAFKYITHCILLSLPFWYKINNSRIKEKLAKWLNIKYEAQYEANIMNIFNNILPITMPVV